MLPGAIIIVGIPAVRLWPPAPAVDGGPLLRVRCRVTGAHSGLSVSLVETLLNGTCSVGKQTGLAPTQPVFRFRMREGRRRCLTNPAPVLSKATGKTGKLLRYSRARDDSRGMDNRTLLAYWNDLCFQAPCFTAKVPSKEERSRVAIEGKDGGDVLLYRDSQVFRCPRLLKEP